MLLCVIFCLLFVLFFFFFKQKTAYEMRISDWSSDVCSSDLLLGDLGAEVIKIERPGQGDDTRKWGPPFVPGADGEDTTESAYYLSANRNKRPVSIDISKPEGQQLARELTGFCDILVENYKVGNPARYGQTGRASVREGCGQYG